MVVDDLGGARMVVSDMLTTAGMHVDQAEGGESAIRQVEAAEVGGVRYDVVVLDWRMPDLDGLETSKRILGLKLPTAPHLIMLTAYGRDGIADQAKAAGITKVLNKPVTHSRLVDTVTAVISGRVIESSDESPLSPTLEGMTVIRGARILLAEDNLLNQQVAGEILRDAGLLVDIAENGKVVLDKVHKAEVAAAQYDLILMDMQMPVMDGIEATRALRANALHSSIPIVAMTAAAMTSDREECLAAGMIDFVAKPVEPEALFKVLLRHIKPRPDMAAAAPMLDLPDLAAPTVATATEVADLPVIPGLDAVSGLRRVLGKVPRYIAMVRGFADSQGGAVAAIRDALAAGDDKTAARVAHTLKGLAGNISAPSLLSAAQSVDHALKAPGETPITTLLDALEKVLAQQILAINLVLPSESESVLESVDQGQLVEVSQQLVGLMASDSNAERLLNAHATLLRSVFPTHYNELHQAVSQFDGERGLEVIQAAIERLGDAALAQCCREALAAGLGTGGGSVAAVALPVLPSTTVVSATPVQAAASIPAAPSPASSSTAGSVTVFDEQRLQTACAQLGAVFENDGNAEKPFKDSADILRKAFPAHFARLQAAVSDFDGEAGLLVLNEAIAARAAGGDHG